MVILGTLITMCLLDTIGRRNILIVGCFMQTFFMLLVAGLGTKKNKTSSDVHGFVASLIIFYVWEKVSLSVNAFLIGSEMGGVRMRKKSESNSKHIVSHIFRTTAYLMRPAGLSHACIAVPRFTTKIRSACP